MTQIQTYIQGLRARISEAPVGRKIIAVEAGLSVQALRDYNTNVWNPTKDTLDKVEAVLDRLDREGESFVLEARRRYNELVAQAQRTSRLRREQEESERKAASERAKAARRLKAGARKAAGRVAA